MIFYSSNTTDLNLETEATQNLHSQKNTLLEEP